MPQISYRLYPGECLTIWMDTTDSNQPRVAAQVELRIVKGRLEIFVSDDPPVIVKQFEDWYSVD